MKFPMATQPGGSEGDLPAAGRMAPAGNGNQTEKAHHEVNVDLKNSGF